MSKQNPKVALENLQDKQKDGVKLNRRDRRALAKLTRKR